jgi:hypothetical protein
VFISFDIKKKIINILKLIVFSSKIKKNLYYSFSPVMEPDIYALPFLESTFDKKHTNFVTVVDSKPILRETVSKQTCKTPLEFCLQEQ